MKAPVKDQKSLLASASSRVESSRSELENVIHLIFLEEFLVLLLVLDDPGSRWMFSDAVLPKKF